MGKKTKKKNNAKIAELKKELLAQQAKIIQARKAVSKRKDIYLVLKATADMEPERFENYLKGFNKSSLETVRAHLRSVENALSQLENLPEYKNIENHTDPQLFYEVAAGIAKLAEENQGNVTIEDLFDFQKDSGEVEKEYNAKIDDLIDEVDGLAEA